MKFTARLISLFVLLVQTTLAAEDEAYFHNLVRDALSYGQTMSNLGYQLNKSYDFSLQNRPASRLPRMSVNPGLQSSAAQVAQSCYFEHSGAPGVGENLFVVTGSNWTFQNAINDWANEARLVSYPNNAQTVGCNDGSSGAGCRSAIGHYTQQVWEDTTEVGCAANYCASMSNSNGPMFLDASGNPRPSTYFVCHYSPQGNYVNASRDYLAPYVGQGVLAAAVNPPATPESGFNLGVLPAINFLLEIN